MLGMLISESLWSGHVWWEVPNLLGSTFYGTRALRSGTGLSILAGTALHFVITGTLGGLFGLACGGIHQRGRLVLLGVLAAVGWYNIANMAFWPRVNPWVPLASPRPATMFSYVLLGACLGYMGQRQKAPAADSSAGQLEPPAAGHLDPPPAIHTESSPARQLEPAAAGHFESSPAGHPEPPAAVHSQSSLAWHPEPAAARHSESSPAGHPESAAAWHSESSPAGHPVSSPAGHPEPAAMGHSEASLAVHSDASQSDTAEAPAEPASDALE